jgi:hypothetical protein
VVFNQFKPNTKLYPDLLTNIQNKNIFSFLHLNNTGNKYADLLPWGPYTIINILALSSGFNQMKFNSKFYQDLFSNEQNLQKFFLLSFDLHGEQ